MNCVAFRGQQCSSDNSCDYCRSWSPEEWARVQDFNDTLASQYERKREEDS